MFSLCLSRNLLDLNHICLKPIATAVPVRNKRSKKRLYWPTNWLPFTWDFPEKPIAIFDTGDHEEKVEDYLNTDKTYKKGYEFLADRDDIPESVKFLFRLSNARRNEITAYINEDRTGKVRRNPYDRVSHEYRIARFTSIIRQLQEAVRYNQPNDVAAKVTINSFKLKRHRFLNELYRMNRERYNIIVDALNIKHEKTVPGVPQNPRLSRKGVLRSLTAEYCENIRKQKLEAYHEELKKQQPLFEAEKEKTLKWIEEMKQKYEITEDDLSTEYRGSLLFNDPPKPRKKAV